MDYRLKSGLYVIMTYFPENNEDYAQTIGRTARAGKEGSFRLIFDKA